MQIRGRQQGGGLLAAVLLAATTAGVQGGVEVPFTKCDYDHMNVQSVQVNALPVVAGTPVTLTLTVTPDRTVYGGTIKTTTTAMRGMTIGSVELNICTDFAGVTCPLQQGVTYSGSYSYPVPGYAPAIKVDNHIVVYDENWQVLACADAKVQLAKAGTSGRRLLAADVAADGTTTTTTNSSLRAVIIEDADEHIHLLKGESSIPYSLCPNTDDLMGVKSITANQGTIRGGDRLVLAVDVTPKRDVNGGSVTVEVSAAGVSMGAAAFSICTQMGVTCPLKKGEPVTLKLSQRVPDISLPVTLTATADIRAFDEATQPLTCMTASVKIGRSINFMMSELGGSGPGSVMEQTPALRKELLAEIKQAGATWQASLGGRFHNVSMAQARRMMGTRLRGEPGYIGLDVKLAAGDGRLVKLAGTFDAATAWPQCDTTISHVRDQGDCGGGWAFASTAVLNDRNCISRADAAPLSPQDTLSCCYGPSCAFSHGCNGGQLAGAWRWFESTGVVTGGDYEHRSDGGTCKPLEVAPCQQYPDKCLDTANQPVPISACRHSCSDANYPVTYQQDKRRAASAYGVSAEEAEIMREIAMNGPVTATMMVYEDFLAYRGGVYYHTAGQPLGGHAVKIVGWGIEGDTPYWSVVNSWGKDWGMEGGFRIVKGVSECGIEDSIVAGSIIAPESDLQ